MSRKRILGVIALLMGALTACDEAPRSVAILTPPGGAWSFVVAATARGPLPVTVHGQSYPGASASETFALVAGGFRKAVTQRVIEVVDGKGAVESPAFLVVWGLDAPTNLNPSRLCDGTPADGLTGPPDPERLHVLVAFCAGSNARAAVRGSVARGEGTDTKGAARLISQMTRQLVGQGKADRS